MVTAAVAKKDPGGKENTAAITSFDINEPLALSCKMAAEEAIDFDSESISD